MQAVLIEVNYMHIIWNYGLMKQYITTKIHCGCQKYTYMYYLQFMQVHFKTTTAYSILASILPFSQICKVD